MAGLAVAALLVTDVVGLATHGERAGAQSIRATVAAASAHTLGSGTARISMTISVQVHSSIVNQTINQGMVGEGDLTHRLMDLTWVSGPAAGAELRLIDGVAYEKLPSGLPLPPGVTTSWVSVSTGLAGAGWSVPGVQGGSDPTQTLAQLESLSNGAVTGTQDLGPADVKGVPTTQYRLDIDVAKVQSQLSAYGTLMGGKLPSMTLHSLSLTVWIDAHGLIRQEQNNGDVTATIQGLAARVVTTVTVDYWDFGLPVDIQPPPPAQVTPISSFASV